MEKIKKISFRNFVFRRRFFLKRNRNENFVVKKGNIPFMISAPHGVSQLRLGKHKVAEPGSLAFALELAKQTGAHLIAKTKNCEDDANFDEHSPYKEFLVEYVKQNNIKFLIDVHGMKKNRPIDINIGTHLGENIKVNENVFDYMVYALKGAQFSIDVDQPFYSGINSIACTIAKRCGIWAIQLEINCKLTNESKYIKKLNILLNCIIKTIEKSETL